MYKYADHVFPAPVVPYAILLAAIFNSVDPLDTLLTKLERTALELPVIVVMIWGEGLDWISLLKNPQWFVGSLLNPLALDGLLYGFTRPDASRLATVHIPTATFKATAAYNMLDDPVTVQDGLEALPAHQMFHPYVNIGMLHRHVSGPSSSL